MIFLIIVSIAISIILFCMIMMTYTKKRKYAKECINSWCKQPGQICKPDSPGADNKTWICDGATWYQVINPEKLNIDKNKKNKYAKYAKECNEWSCDQPGQICLPNAVGAENKPWICDGESWHQIVKPY